MTDETTLIARALDLWDRERQEREARLAGELDEMESLMERAVEQAAWSRAFAAWGKEPVR